jgi:hypothetical protein
MTPTTRRPEYSPGSLSDTRQVCLCNAEGQRMTTAAYSVACLVGLSVMEDTRPMIAPVIGEDCAEAYKATAGSLGAKGWTLHTCGACAAFRFSSMSYQMSSEGKGCCTVAGVAHTGQADVVSLLGRCSNCRARSAGRFWLDEED